MRRSILLFVPIFLCVHLATAQVDAPVAGHAAIAFDLLKKDYSAIDPANRQEEIMRDRTTVISILKAYLQDDKKQKLESGSFKKWSDSLIKLRKQQDILKKTIDSYSAITMNVKDEDDANDISQKITTAYSNLAELKIEYFEASFEIDTCELGAIGRQYLNNQFLAEIDSLFMQKYKAIKEGNLDKYAASSTASAIQKSIPFIGGNLSFETAIDGLSRFLAKRIKEELTTYVIEKLQKSLNNQSPDDPFAEFKVLLPRTCSYFSGFTADQLLNFTHEIKQYIEDDLSHMLTNATNLRNTPRINAFIKSHPDIDFAFEALELIPAISNVKYPMDYFTFLDNSRNISRWKEDSLEKEKFNIANTISLTSLLTRSLVVIDNGEPRFAGVDFLTSYAAETNFYKLYIGFLKQQNIKYYNVKFERQGEKTLDTLLFTIINSSNSKMFEEKELVKNIIINASQNAEKIFNIATDIRKANKAGKKIGIDTVYNFIEGIISFSEGITVAADSLILMLDTTSEDKPNLSKLIKPYFIAARTTNEVIKDIKQKKYATGIIKFIELGSRLSSGDEINKSSFVNSLLSLDLKETTKNLSEFIKTARNKDTIEAEGKHVKFNNKFKEIAVATSVELINMKRFCISNKISGAIRDEIVALASVCVKELQKDSVLKSSIKTIKTLFDKEDFKKIVISYYSSLVIDTLFNTLKKEMTSLKINDSLIFTNGEPDTLKNQLTNFAIELFNVHVLKSSNKELDKNRRIITATLVSYLTILPQKFNVHLNTNLSKLINFVNDMAFAQNAEDVEKAIDVFALPSGSYSIKRKSKFNFAINAYPGILLSRETSYKPEGNLHAFSVGFTAPVGISYSRGCSNGGSWGFFVPIIDIGAVTRLRLDTSSATKTLPDFNFKNILSPGIFFSYGFKKSPFSVNAGVQYGPELKEILSDGSTKSYESMRFGIGLVLDIPLFNLHTSPR